MNPDSKVRTMVRQIPPLYWLAGLVNYLRFRRGLAREERIYRAVGQVTSPPPLLRYRVHRAFDEASYIRNGQTIAQALADALNGVGVELWNLDVLDFACGPGRVIREFQTHARGCRMYGSDIDAEAIAWAQAHLADVASFSINAAAAPSSFAANQFDVIYCVSLFTHLDERAQDEWLREMARILKPGGVFVTTTHGRHALGSCTTEERAQLQREGFVYRVERKGRFKVDGLPDFYQTTFHTRAYVAARWGSVLPLVQHIEGGLNGHQDIVVMRKRAAADRSR
jgi:Methylase involved in ubiquinone/menaquinone biosynthesis